MPKKQTRDLAPARRKTKPKKPRGRSLIAVIGIDNYAHWPQLQRAVSDALGVHPLFVEKLGFLSPVAPLINADATEDAILSLVQDQLPTLLQPDDSLIIFFAGHGHTRVREVGDHEIETGYLIPVEAHTDRWRDYIKIDSFLEDASQLPARHVLVILDACHSGFALGNAMQMHRDAVRYEADLQQRVSRKVITSARHQQVALDGGPVPGHSLFTGTLVEGFNWGTVDTDGNGLVTAFELGLFLQQRVGQASIAKQTPDFGSFRLDERGELVISLRDDNFDAIKARAFTALRKHDLAEFRMLVAKVMALRPTSPEALYLQYRLHFFDGDIEGALARVDQLRTLDFSSGILPVSPQDLIDLSVQLRFWQPILTLPSGVTPMEISLLAGPNQAHLAAAPQVTVAGDAVFQIKNGSIARFQVVNSTNATAHLYQIAITTRGLLRIGPLAESDAERFDGVAPLATTVSPPFMVKGPPGVYETRIFYSSTRISPMLFPPSTATRSISLLEAEQVAQVQMKTIWHEILGGAEREEHLAR